MLSQALVTALVLAPAAAVPAEPAAGMQPSERGAGVGLQAPGLVTSVELGESHRPADDIARTQAHAPGMALRSLGGLGRFGALSPRPSGGAAVFVDRAPVSAGVAGIVELPSILLDEPARVDIYRSAVPIEYGAAAIGEALDVSHAVHRGPARLWAAGGIGSFLTREVRAGFVVAAKPHLSFAGDIGYAGSRGDFPYYDDVGTPLLFGDDGRRRRASNQYDDTHVQLRVDHERGQLLVSSLLMAYWRQQGVPGPRGAWPSGASSGRVSLRSITRVRRAVIGPGGYVEWITSLAAEGRRFRDREAVIGPAADDEIAASLDAWVSPRLRAPIWRQGWLTISAELRGEYVDIRDRSSPLDPAQLSTGDAQRRRLHAGIGAQLEQWLFERRWAVIPAMHVDLAASDFAVPAGQGEVDDVGQTSTVIGFSPRFATSFELIQGLQLRGSVGRSMRLPTLVELFGDRGYLVGNEGLRAEGGTRVDGGLSLLLDELGGRPIFISAQLLGFVSWNSQLIQWVRESSAAVTPVNIARARLRGLELGTNLRAYEAELVLTYVLLDSTNSSDGISRPNIQIPGRPRHRLLARPSVGHHFEAKHGRALDLEPRVFYELEWLSATILDVDGNDELPARSLHAVGVSLRLGKHVELGLEARNLANVGAAIVNEDGDWPGPYPVAISDLMGFPLASRSFWASVRIDATLRGTRPDS